MVSLIGWSCGLASHVALATCRQSWLGGLVLAARHAAFSGSPRARAFHAPRIAWELAQGIWATRCTEVGTGTVAVPDNAGGQGTHLPRAHEAAARRAATRTTQSAQRTLCQRGLPLPSQQQGQELAGAPIKTALNADDEHLCVPKQPKLSALAGHAWKRPCGALGNGTRVSLDACHAAAQRKTMARPELTHDTIATIFHRSVLSSESSWRCPTGSARSVKDLLPPFCFLVPLLSLLLPLYASLRPRCVSLFYSSSVPVLCLPSLI